MFQLNNLFRVGGIPMIYSFWKQKLDLNGFQSVGLKLISKKAVFNISIIQSLTLKIERRQLGRA